MSLTALPDELLAKLIDHVRLTPDAVDEWFGAATGDTPEFVRELRLNEADEAVYLLDTARSLFIVLGRRDVTVILRSEVLKSAVMERNSNLTCAEEIEHFYFNYGKPSANGGDVERMLAIQEPWEFGDEMIEAEVRRRYADQMRGMLRKHYRIGDFRIFHWSTHRFGWCVDQPPVPLVGRRIACSSDCEVHLMNNEYQHRAWRGPKYVVPTNSESEDSRPHIQESRLYRAIVKSFFVASLELGYEWHEILVKGKTFAGLNPSHLAIRAQKLERLLEGTLHFGATVTKEQPLRGPLFLGYNEGPVLGLRNAEETVAMIAVPGVGSTFVVFAVGTSTQPLGAYHEQLSLHVFCLLDEPVHILAACFERGEDAEPGGRRGSYNPWTASEPTCARLASALGVEASEVGSVIRWVVIAANPEGQGQSWWRRIERWHGQGHAWDPRQPGKADGGYFVEEWGCDEGLESYWGTPSPPQDQYTREFWETHGLDDDYYGWNRGRAYIERELRTIGGAAAKDFPRINIDPDVSCGRDIVEYNENLALDTREFPNAPAPWGASPRKVLEEALAFLEKKKTALAAATHPVLVVKAMRDHGWQRAVVMGVAERERRENEALQAKNEAEAAAEEAEYQRYLQQRRAADEQRSAAEAAQRRRSSLRSASGGPSSEFTS